MSSTGLLPAIFVPTFEMKVGDTVLKPEIARHIQSITVNQRSGVAGTFTIHLYDPGLEMIKAKGGQFTEGQQVEISIGYVGKQKLKKMIEGKIKAVTADFPSSGPPMIQVDGFDRLHDLTLGTSHQSSAGSTPDSASADSQVVSDTGSKSNLKVSVDSTEKRTRPRVQNNVTDFDFLQDLAQQNGYLLWVEDGTLNFKQDRPAPNRLRLEWGKTLNSFSPRLTTTGQVKNVLVRGWDPDQKQSVVGKADRTSESELSDTGQQTIAKGSGGNSVITITKAPVSSQKEADALAKAIMANMKKTVITGSGSCVGQPGMQVGSILEIKGTARFDGDYTVAEVTHTISESGYQTSFEVNNAPSLAGLSPLSGGRGTSMHEFASGVESGPVIGLVIDNKDPQKLGKVKVKFPRLTDEEIGHWARIATPMAGPQRGMFFLPEVDDEVLVVFEQGDITRPYVIGALWNGKDKPPDTNADLRFIKSRSGHLVRLDDTDGSEKIEIIDKSGKNSITIDTANKTITITSAQDINIEAKDGTIKLSAKNISISSSADTKVEAQGGLTLEGKGDTTLKGQKVNIN